MPASFRGNIDLAVKHYSSLFKLPSYKGTITCLFVGAVLLGFSGNVPLSPSASWFIGGFILGLCVFTASLLTEYFSSRLLLRKDVILNLRRCLFLSFFSNMLLFTFILVAHALLFYFPNLDLFIKVVSLGFFADLALRFLVIFTVSFSGTLRKFLSGLLQPSALFALISFAQMKNFLTFYTLYFLLAIAFSMLGVWLFRKTLDNVGMKTFGVPSLKLFRAFLADWTESFEQPFEEILEQIGEERDINVSLLMFRGKYDNKLKAILVVPNLHPGPFKNIGSSPLPELIQALLEREAECVVSVPHGISGHELDLASQDQNKKILDFLSRALMEEADGFSNEASPFLMVERKGAKAGCQVFGGCVLLTLTLAPETMEDLPLELNDIISREAEKMGFSLAIAIDAHNSINGPFNLEKATMIIKEAALSALEEATRLRNEISAMRVGAGKFLPEDLGLKDGMGPGGITAVLVEVDGRRTAYVTIDGNNMVSNLRGKILSALREMGIECGEVFTTDTHIVNGVVLADRGYHPVGEVVDHEKIIEYTRKAVLEAVKSMGEATAAWRRVIVPKVKVVGEKQIGDLGLLTDRVAKKAKLSSIIFIFLGSAFMALSMLL
jgi:putative membrane protein